MALVDFPLHLASDTKVKNVHIMVELAIKLILAIRNMVFLPIMVNLIQLTIFSLKTLMLEMMLMTPIAQNRMTLIVLPKINMHSW